MDTLDQERGYRSEPSLTGSEYVDPQVFDRERAHILFEEWMCVARDKQIPEPGDYLLEEVAGEPLLISRDRAGQVRAFHNVCRHRGALLCDDESGRAASGVFKCPYHAWTYDLEGRLVATPNVSRDEGFDRDSYGLWACPVDTWGGFIFVNVSGQAPPLRQALADDPEEPMQFERFSLDRLRLGKNTTFEVRANWKIIVDNYNECLHCPSVHKELSALVPVFRRGEVAEDPDSWTVSLREGATSFTMSGTSSLPPLPGIKQEDLHVFRGCYLFPNLMLNLTSDSLRYFILLPRNAGHTTIRNGYLFAPSTIEADMDLSDVIGFGEMVARQDWSICERAQRGCATMRFREFGGVYPYQDRLLADFKHRYHRSLGRDRRAMS